MPRERWKFWLVLVLGLGAFAYVVSRADLTRTFALLSATGPLLLLALPAYLVQIGFDSLAWRTLLGKLGRRVAWTRLVAVRLSTEAVLMSMPAGGVVAETLKPYLLRKTDGVPFATTVASLGGKKSLLVLAQAVYLALALILGHALLVEIAPAIVPGLPWLVLGGVVFLAAVGGGLSLALLGGELADRVHRLLGRLPIARLRAWLAGGRGHFADADAGLARLGARPRGRLLGAFACFLLAWLAETVETFLLLHILGVDLPVVQVLVLEACAVFLRSIVFFLPAGLGVQDAGYLGFLRAYGVSADLGAAFVILKRAKELFWIAVGYLVMFALERCPAPIAEEVRT